MKCVMVRYYGQEHPVAYDCGDWSAEPHGLEIVDLHGARELLVAKASHIHAPDGARGMVIPWTSIAWAAW